VACVQDAGSGLIPAISKAEEPTMATKHFTEKPAKKKTTKLAGNLPKVIPEKLPKDNSEVKFSKDHKEHKDGKDSKELKDTKEHNKHEHKEHPWELPIQPTQVLGWNLTPGAATPEFAPDRPPIKPKPLKELLKDYLFDHMPVKVHKEFDKYYEQKVYEGPIDSGGPIEQRLQALEAAVSQSAHFIPQALRPDLSQGALKQESDVAKKSRARKAKKSVVKSTKGTR